LQASVDLLHEKVNLLMSCLTSGMRPPTPAPTTEDGDALPDRLPPEVEAEIASIWGDSPGGARIARQVALARIRAGVEPDAVRRGFRERGQVVE
jgi:hypothetical protein